MTLEVEHGWLAGRPSEQLVEWSIARQKRGDAAKPNDMRNVACAEKRARGFVAERLLVAWLRSEYAEFTANGGPDALPDLELDGVRVGVRLCASKGRFEPHHRIYVFDRHVANVDEWFFCGVEMDTNRYLLLGGIHRLHFIEHAVAVPPGCEVCRGFIAEEWVWVQRADVLTPPRDWLRSHQRIAA